MSKSLSILALGLAFAAPMAHAEKASSKKTTADSAQPVVSQAATVANYGDRIVTPFGTRDRNFESGRR